MPVGGAPFGPRSGTGIERDDLTRPRTECGGRRRRELKEKVASIMRLLTSLLTFLKLLSHSHLHTDPFTHTHIHPCAHSLIHLLEALLCIVVECIQRAVLRLQHALRDLGGQRSIPVITVIYILYTLYIYCNR